MCYAGFLLDAALSIAMTAMPFFVYTELGGDEATSGYIGGASSAAYAAACIVLTRFVSRAKNGLHWAVAGMVIFAVLFVSIVFLRQVWLCGVLCAAAFSCMSLVWPALHAWIGSDADPDRRKRHTGWFNVAWSSGMAMGPLLAGPLIDLHYTLSFGTVFVLVVISILLVVSLPHERHHFVQASEDQLSARASHDTASEAYLYSAWCATLTMNCLIGIARNVYPKRVEELVNSGKIRVLFEESPPEFLSSSMATQYSWLVFALSLATAVVFFYLGHSSRWRHNFAWLACVQLAAGGAFWLLGHTESLLLMMMAFGLLGAGIGMAFFSSVTYSLVNPALKHRRTTVNEAMVGVGGFMGSVVFGEAVSRAGFAGPFHWMPLAIVAAVGLQWAMLRHRRGAIS